MLARMLTALLIAAGVSMAADASRIEAIFAPLADGKSPGVAVLVRKDGKTVLERGYGVRDLRTKASIDAHTNFRLASFTKQLDRKSVV